MSAKQVALFIYTMCCANEDQNMLQELACMLARCQHCMSILQTWSPYALVCIKWCSPASLAAPEWGMCADRGDCDQYVASLWDWLEGLGTGLRRQDPTTWTPDRWPPTYRGILNSLGIAHQAFVWRIRKHERIRKVRAACQCNQHGIHFAVPSSHLCRGTMVLLRVTTLPALAV